MNINEILDQIEAALEGKIAVGVDPNVRELTGSAEITAFLPPQASRYIVDRYRAMEARAGHAEYVVDCFGKEIQALNAEIKRLESSRDGYARKSDAHEEIAGEWKARAEKAERALAEARRDISDAAVTFRAVNVAEALASMNIDVDVLQQWQSRAEAAEAKVKIAEKGLEDIAEFCGDEPGAARASFMATVAKRTLAAMEATDE